MSRESVEITYDAKGWPHADCPNGKPMGWLGSVFFMCHKENGCHHKGGSIFVVVKSDEKYENPELLEAKP